MKSLREDLASRFKTKLERSSVISASRWACLYRIMDGDFKGNWSFDRFPWLKDMHDSTCEFNIGQKAAQLGYSETMMNIAFYNLDIKHRNVLYILPNQRPDAADFSNRGLKTAIECSPHIKGMFSSTNNVGLKQVGSSNLYIRGSNSRSQLKSIPAAVLIFDEFDEMQQKNIPLAEERASGQAYRLNWKVSTPTTPNRGINTLFQKSTQDHFFFKCPSCSKLEELTFPDSLVVVGDDPDRPEIYDSHLICRHCKNKLPHEAKSEFLKTGRWVSMQPGQNSRGFYINQLYSPALPPWKLAVAWLEGKKSHLREQEFYNSKMGLPHIVAGAQLTEEMVGACIKGFPMIEGCRQGNVVTMGIDIGRRHNVEVCLWDLSQANGIDINAKARPKVLWAGEIDDLCGQGGELMSRFNVTFCVVDAMPEMHTSLKFANEWYGRARICRYNHFATARSVFAGENDSQVSVNRTAWMDQALGRFRNGSILLPNNIPQDYIRQIMSPVRKPDEDSQGNLIYRYVEQDGVPDHYAHARVYSEIALLFATGQMVYKPMKEKA